MSILSKRSASSTRSEIHSPSPPQSPVYSPSQSPSPPSNLYDTANSRKFRSIGNPSTHHIINNQDTEDTLLGSSSIEFDSDQENLYNYENNDYLCRSSSQMRSYNSTPTSDIWILPKNNSDIDDTLIVDYNDVDGIYL